MLEAIVALIGTAITATIAYLGTRLNSSLERRNLVIQQEAEERLKLEAALKAVELINKAEKEPQESGATLKSALFVLKSLDQNDLALSIAEQIWLDNHLTTRFFIDFIDDAFLGEDEKLKGRAISAIRSNPKRFLTDKNAFNYPDSIFLTWDKKRLGENNFEVRESILDIAMSRPFKDWKSNCPNQFLYFLYKSLDDENERLRFTSARYIIALIEGAKMQMHRTFEPPDIKRISIEEIHHTASTIVSSFGEPYGRVLHDQYVRAEELRKWAEGEAHDKSETLLLRDN